MKWNSLPCHRFSIDASYWYENEWISAIPRHFRAAAAAKNKNKKTFRQNQPIKCGHPTIHHLHKFTYSNKRISIWVYEKSKLSTMISLQRINRSAVFGAPSANIDWLHICLFVYIRQTAAFVANRHIISTTFGSRCLLCSPSIWLLLQRNTHK